MIKVIIDNWDVNYIYTLEHVFPEYISNLEELEQDYEIVSENILKYLYIIDNSYITKRYKYCICCKNGCGAFIYTSDYKKRFIFSSFTYKNASSYQVCSKLIIENVLL